MKKLVLFLAVALLVLGFHFIIKDKNQKIKIGILAPMQHKAMEDIAIGFKEEILRSFKDEIEVHFENASGDKVLLSALINKFKGQKYDYIASIGTESTLLALNSIPDHPVIGLDISQDLNKISIDNLAPVFGPLDLPSVNFIQSVVPGIKKFTLVYSSSDRNFEEAQVIKRKALKADVKVQFILVDTLADLYTLEQKIQQDSEAIFILKDHLCVSGAPTIAQVAKRLNIPFFSSDEGSVQAGALAALSNSEVDVGRQGATLATKMIRGEKIQSIKPVYIDKFTLFINQQKKEQTQFLVPYLEEYARIHNYNIQYLNSK